MIEKVRSIAMVGVSFGKADRRARENARRWAAYSGRSGKRQGLGRRQRQSAQAGWLAVCAFPHSNGGFGPVALDRRMNLSARQRD
jgi:hypothetical protein